MKKQKINLRFGILALLVFVAAFSRLLPHPPNFTPIGAMALFGAAYFTQRFVAFMVPLLSLWLSDLVLNNVVYAQYYEGFTLFHPGFYWSYGTFIIIGLVGMLMLNKVKPLNILLASLSASTLFFIISNFGVWMSGFLYTKDINGLITCYTAAIPFFRNGLMGDLVYAGLLFGAFEFAQYKYPALRTSNINQ